MKIKELNRRIFHNSSQVSQADYLAIVEDCYSRVAAQRDREDRMRACVGKWQRLYGHLGSEELLQSYSVFFRGQ